MEHNEQGQRDGVAKEFQESLDQLQNLLEENQTEEKPEKELTIKNNSQKPATKKPPKFDLADWEDAIADIEQYFDKKNEQTDGT
ncbi:hypothetical protein Riv7116_0493 [Rivularia sp. PCC 7116]|uniref:hypothetical protein n=1 Tax=Rivularia sp. PCC 7116 TaxID=373994 RepID=UPI00029F216A|nr:hypothetical protein [Rivularia sp. PCC 7116]AFY53091.1 hypothetical protein Riv7116_0493 [Rivularia sp. PCC 7116]